MVKLAKMRRPIWQLVPGIIRRQIIRRQQESDLPQWGDRYRGRLACLAWRDGGIEKLPILIVGGGLR